jgi:hypothetical protein
MDCAPGWKFEIEDSLQQSAGNALAFAVHISKHETNSNDKNINDQNGERYHHSAFVLNFYHVHFDIVSDFDIRTFTTFDAFRQQLNCQN